MRRSVVVAIAPVLLLVACAGSTAKPHASAPPPASTPSTRATTTTSASSTTTLAPTTTTAPPTTTTPHTTPPTTRAPVTTPATAPPPAPALTVPPGTSQVIVASASSYGSTYATYTAYQRVGATWTVAFGPWTARVGRNGFAPPGAKREGDGRTPSGTYGFSFFFGIDTDPGVHFSYRRVTSSAIVWDDDPASSNYNEWIDTRVAAAGVRPEPMYNAPVYDYGAVIAYNTTRVAGLGSAIFMHVSDGSSTAGCVALPVNELLDVLRWLDPGRAPVIAMGVGVPAP